MKTLHALMFGALGASFALAPAAGAKEVKMVFSFALPPYVIKDAGGQASGFEFEIIKAALAVKGHTVTPVFAAMGAIAKTLADGQADAAQRGSPDLREGSGYFYADEPTVTYQDVAISLKKNALAIHGVGDLKDKSIIAFQGASNFLGAEFGAVAKSNAKYSESSDEKRRVQQLYAGGAQAYVGDLNVFKYYKASASGVDVSQEVTIHKVFTAAPQQFNNAVFRDKQIRDDFNAGLKQLKSSAQYKQIIKKYVAE
ncbi:MAG: transporter substrate-binding domain-containing protein [Pseudomonadota bacterium]